MDQILGFLPGVHALIRWFILSLGVVGAARSFVSMLSVSAKFTRLDIGLCRAYSVLLDVQGLFGMLLLLAALTTQQPLTTLQWLHPLIMLPAIIVGHLYRRFQSQPDRARHQAQLGIFVGSLVLVAIGLAIINELYLPM